MNLKRFILVRGLSISGISLFAGFVIYKYATSKKLRKSVNFSAGMIVTIIGPFASSSTAKEVDAFTSKKPPIIKGSARQQQSGVFSRSGSGPDKPDDDPNEWDDDDQCQALEIPKFELKGDADQRVDNFQSRIDKAIKEKDEETDSESEDSDFEESKNQRALIQTKQLGTDGKHDLRKCYGEMERRSKILKNRNPKFSCSFERYSELATENGKVTSGITRDTLTGEMLGYWKGTTRNDYSGIDGPEYQVTGLGKYAGISFIEIKGLTGTNIMGPSRTIEQECAKTVRKIKKQQNFWSSPTKRAGVAGLKQDAPFPEKPEHMLGVIDFWDVPKSEKPLFQAGIEKYSENPTSLQFMHNEENL